MSGGKADRLREARKAAGFGSAAEAAERFGWTVSAYRHHENGTRGFDADTAQKYARAFKVKAGWLLGFEAGAPSHPDIPPTRSADGGETVPIMSLDLSVSMGPGTPIEDFVESEPVQFDLAMLRLITRTTPNRLRFIRGIGDSMEPKLLTGDRILVDTTERQLGRFDGYYWITLWGAHGLKRLRPAGPNKVEVVSVNPEHDNIIVDAEDLTIEGRALWFAREL